MSVVPLSYNFDAMESQIKGDVAAIRDLCTLAVSRMQTHIDPVHKTGPVVFQQSQKASNLHHPPLFQSKARRGGKAGVWGVIFQVFLAIFFLGILEARMNFATLT